MSQTNNGAEPNAPKQPKREDLIKIAKELGVAGADGMKVADLKEAIDAIGKWANLPPASANDSSDTLPPPPSPPNLDNGQGGDGNGENKDGTDPLAGTPDLNTPTGSENDKDKEGVNLHSSGVNDLAANPPPPPAPPNTNRTEGKRRIKCEALKGGKIFLSTGEVAAFDKDGVLELDEAEAAVLLTIPGYEEA